MAYHKYSSRSRSSSTSSDDDMTRRRVQQMNEEIKIERPSESNYYSDKMMRKAHKRRVHRAQ